MKAINDFLKFENYRIQILFSRSSANQYAGLVTATVYALFEGSRRSSSFWTAWAICYFLFFLLRVYTHRLYFKAVQKTPELKNPGLFEKRLIIGNFITGCIWAAAAFQLLSETDVDDVIFLSFVLAGNTAGAAVGYCASFWATAGFIFPALVPMMMMLFWDGRPFLFNMGCLLALYLLVNTVLFRNLHRHILDTIHLRFEKDRLMKELVEAQRKAVYAEKMAALGEMSGGIAHEINNPLAIIQLANDQIQKHLRTQTPPDNELLIKLSVRVQNTVQRVSKIIESLRVFSRDGTGDSYESVAVSKLVEETVDLCREKFKNSPVVLTITPPTGTDLSVYGNRVQLSQILLNLLNNGFDAVKELANGTLDVSWRQADENVEILVSDNGVGIPTEIADKVFQPFFSTKPVGQGTGLGLSISLGIMQAHDGALFFEARQPGTTFVMRLQQHQA